MTTTVYLIRHSERLGVKKLNYNDSQQVRNEKIILSVKGEEKAKILSELPEFINIDHVISSSYVRAIATAKYMALKNNLDVYIDEDFGERELGDGEYTPEFEFKQTKEEHYKYNNGESQVDARERFYNALMNAVNMYKGKKIAIFCHATVLMYIFGKWCDIGIEDNTYIVKCKNKVVFNHHFNAPEIFKLVFDDKELISIENIRPSELEY